MVQGAMAVLASGVKTPAKVLAATDDYRVSEDTLASFVRDECNLNAHTYVTVPDFTHRYEAHCREMGVDPLSSRAVTMRLTSEYAVTQGRRSRPSARLYQGIELVNVDDEG